MTHPAGNDERDYRFTFRSQRDRITADLYAHMEVLRIHGATGNAVLLVTWHGGDLPQLPVGLFGTTLTKQQAAAPATAVEGIKWADLPKPQGGDINAAILSVDFSRGNKIIQRSMNAQNFELLQALAPVMSQVSDLSTMLESHPLRAIKASVVWSGAGFRLTLQNVGSGSVLLADPRHVPAAPANQPRATISVAESPPGTDFMYLSWETVPLEALGSAPSVTTLGPGKTLDVNTVAWSPKVAGDHYVRAVWHDYVGPRTDPKDVMETIPDPDKMNDPRPYVVRGTAFSGAIKFIADRPRR